MTVRILYVVVLYNQNFKEINAYNSFLKYVSENDVWIWDNSSNKNNEWLANSQYRYTHSIKNVGISYAYNRAAEYANSHDYKWLMLLDQDTTFPRNSISVISHNLITCGDRYALFCPVQRITDGRIISPLYSYLGLVHSKKEIQGQFVIDNVSIINSGLLIRLDLFNKVGGYNESAFLDYSDWQFVDRCAQVEKYAYCMDLTCLQDFSGICRDKKKVLDRYILFCQSLKGCEKRSVCKWVGYNLVVLKRCLSIMLRLKTISPVSIYVNHYLLK